MWTTLVFLLYLFPRSITLNTLLILFYILVLGSYGVLWRNHPFFLSFFPFFFFAVVSGNMKDFALRYKIYSGFKLSTFDSCGLLLFYPKGYWRGILFVLASLRFTYFTSVIIL